MLTFARNPFARESRTRRRVWVAGAASVARIERGCGWCGQLRHTRRGRAYLYRYGVTPDAGRDFEDSRLFCSVACCDTFYGRR
jgi:hypothetical protein